MILSIFNLHKFVWNDGILSQDKLLTRPTLERRKAFGHLRSLYPNMIIHFANQSDLPTFEIFNKIPVRCILPSLFLCILDYYPCCWIFPGQLHFHSFALFIFPEFWKWSGVPFPFCVVLLPHFLALDRPFITLITSCLLWIFFLALSAKSFCDCKYLSTIACASEGTFGESTAAQFLLDNSPLFDIIMYICFIRYARFSNACFANLFLTCRPLISFTNLIKSLSLFVTIFLHFRHD